ncbi:MAG TPA: TIR domain-containing protein [Thermoanaerobaculia bacterium]|nr:TIR domain-containing protein [Thermoanaerobaculia bacterium]
MKPPVETVRTIDIRGSGGWSASWVSWSPKGRMLAVGAVDVPAIRFINANSGQTVRELKTAGGVLYAEWSRDEQFLAAMTDKQIIVWNWPRGDIAAEFRRHGTVLAWNPRKPLLATSAEEAIVLLDPKTRRQSEPFRCRHVRDAAWLSEQDLLIGTGERIQIVRHDLPDDSLFEVAGADHAGHVVTACRSYIWAASVGNEIALQGREGPVRIEHHRAPVTALSFSSDHCHYLVARSADGETSIWSLFGRPALVTAFANASPSNTFRSIAFSPVEDLLATPVAYGSAVAILGRGGPGFTPKKKTTFYTTAKIALVGDSGVGKTGLGWRLAHDEFKHHESTHGEQFWVMGNISTVREDGAQCEAVLFDLAGQPDYRLTHTLFLDDVDVALIVFDPTNGQDPLQGAQFWLQALRKRARTILVPARSDRGTGIFTPDELTRFAQQEGITGGVVFTSALNGEGIDELLSRIRDEVNWDGRPATVTTETFKAIKDHVLQLKEADSKSGVLLTPQQLRDAVSEAAKTDFAREDVATAARHLANHGYVRELRGSHGDEWILLAPQLLHNLAASIVLEARRNPKGLGALHERRLLAGEYRFPELDRLTEREREILLDGAAALFIEHNVCFREALGNDVFLVFPSLINLNRPQLDDTPMVDGSAYVVSGATASIYPALVVLLGYTNTFTRTNQWRNNARYEIAGGATCGFRLTDEREGQIELELYFAESAPPPAQQLFQGLFETFLAARPVTVEAFPPLFCPSCRYAQPRKEVMKRKRQEQEQLFCSNCGTRVPLGAPAAPPGHDEAVERNRRVAASRTHYANALSRMKSYLRDAAITAPSCFISYARGIQEQERWVEVLARDLLEAGIRVVFDRFDNRGGGSISRFAERIDQEDFVIVIGTPALLAKYDGLEGVVAGELLLASKRLSKGVLPILLDGDAATAFPPLYKDTVHFDFRHEEHYFERLFDLLLVLYGIPYEEKAVQYMRDALHFRPA